MTPKSPNLIEKSKDFPKRITQCCGIVGQRIYDRSGYIPLTCPRCGSEDYDNVPNSKPFVPEEEKSKECCNVCAVRRGGSGGGLPDCYNKNCPCHTPQLSTPNYIESVLHEFDEKFYTPTNTAWKNDWSLLPDDVKSFLSTALEKQQKQFIEKIEKELKECCGNGKNLSVLGKGVKIGLEKTLSLLKE